MGLVTHVGWNPRPLTAAPCVSNTGDLGLVHYYTAEEGKKMMREARMLFSSDAEDLLFDSSLGLVYVPIYSCVYYTAMMNTNTACHDLGFTSCGGRGRYATRSTSWAPSPSPSPKLPSDAHAARSGTKNSRRTHFGGRRRHGRTGVRGCCLRQPTRRGNLSFHSRF